MKRNGATGSRKTNPDDWLTIKWLFGKKLEIPRDWSIVKLGKMFELKKGKVPKSFTDNKNSEVYLSMEFINTNKKKFTDDLNMIKIKKSDIIIIGDGDGSGRVYTQLNGVLSSTFILLKPLTKKLDNKFVFYLLNLRYPIFEATKYGTSIPHLDKYILNNLLIFFPNSKEQKKIASILSNIDALIESTDTLIKQIEIIKSGLLQKLLVYGINKKRFKNVKWIFDKKIQIVESWDYPKFSSVVTINPKTKTCLEFVPYVAMDAVSSFNSNIAYFEKRAVSDNHNLPKFINNDVLFARITPSTENGKTALIKKFSGIGIASSELTVLRPTKKLIPEYLYYIMKSYKIRSYAISQMLGSTNRQRVPEYVFEKDLHCILPTLPEQRRIASILSNVDAYIMTIMSKLSSNFNTYLTCEEFLHQTFLKPLKFFLIFLIFHYVCINIRQN